MNSKRTAYFSAIALGMAWFTATPAQAQGPVFNFVGVSNFIDFTTWDMYGSAYASNISSGSWNYSVLRLTAAGEGGQGGAAFAPSTVSLDFNAAFNISFDYYMVHGSVIPGDGMVFVLTADNPMTVNGGGPLVPGGGSDLGYGGSGLTGLAFAIDTFNFNGEPVAPSIQILQDGSTTPVAYTETGLTDMADPSYYQWHTELSYTPSGNSDMQGTLTGTITQFIGNLSFSVSAGVDGSTLSGVPLYYGFTAGNGLADDGHYVSSAVPVPEPETYAMLLAGLGLIGLRFRRSTSIA